MSGFFSKLFGGGGDKAAPAAIPESSKFRLKSYLAEEDGGDGEAGAIVPAGTTAFATKPIADLFPNTTVMFADIAGFTAWSSVREPTQVFTLLETVYRAFDSTAP